MIPRNLRIGNLINCPDGNIDVEMVSKSAVYFKDVPYFFDEIEPISLTEEWIIKLGFEWSIPHQAYYLKGFDYVIDFYENHPKTSCNLGFFKKFTRNGETLISVKYLHEIQNLYFALTQTELTLS